MRALALLFLAAAAPAQADLYRWVDPDSGSVKFANAPPPWYETGSGPAVERIPSAPAAKPAPLEKPAAKPTPAALEARWRTMLQSFTGLRQAEFTSPDEAMRQRIAAFQALTSELDMVDPAGKARRTEEQISLMQTLKP